MGLAQYMRVQMPPTARPVYVFSGGRIGAGRYGYRLLLEDCFFRMLRLAFGSWHFQHMSIPAPASALAPVPAPAPASALAPVPAPRARARARARARTCARACARACLLYTSRSLLSDLTETQRTLGVSAGEGGLFRRLRTGGVLLSAALSLKMCIRDRYQAGAPFRAAW